LSEDSKTCEIPDTQTVLPHTTRPIFLKMAEQRERPLNELLSRDMVDLYVGSENTHWILHEKLLCYRSKFFRDIFYNKDSHNKTMGLPDEDDEPFKLFVGWLYSGAVPTPSEEKDLGNLFDLYLMGEKWQIKNLVVEVLDSVRAFYWSNETYPGLRRVQYVYANTQQESPMRQLLVSSVARFLILGEGIPQHWDKALRKNGQLAVDIIMEVQKWHLEEERVPDVRDQSVVPIFDASEAKREERGQSKMEDAPQVKKEEEEDDEGPQGQLTNGVDHELPNGVGGDDDHEE